MMMNCLKIYFSNMRLRTQLIIFSTLTISAIMLSIFLISNLQIELMYNIQAGASKQAAQQQVWNEMISIQKQQVQLIQSFADIVKKQMKIVNDLLNKQMSLGMIDQGKRKEHPQYLFQTINLTNRQQINSQSDQKLVQEWLPLIFNYDQIIPVNEIFWITKDNVLTFYNYENQTINYYTKIEEQYWYLNWMFLSQLTDDQQSILSFQYVNPCIIQIIFLDLPQYCSLSAGLFDENKNQYGIISSQYLMRDFLQVFNELSTSNIGIQYLLTNDGKFIYSDEHGTLSIQEFSNQNLTGYDKDDWDAIKTNNFQINNCQNLIIQKMVCRYNSLYKMDTIVSSDSVMNQQIYFISIAQQTKYLNYIDDFFNTFSNKVQIYLETFIIIYCSGGLLIVLTTGFIINRLLVPLNYIQYDMIIKSFKQQKFNDLLDLKRRSYSKQYLIGSLSHLIKAYRHLTYVNQIANNSLSKECQQIQKFKYYKKCFHFNLRLQYVQKQQNQLKNQQLNDSLLVQQVFKLIMK